MDHSLSRNNHMICPLAGFKIIFPIVYPAPWVIQLAAQPREQPGFHHRSSDSLADPPPFLASVSVASCRLTCLTLAATKRIRPRSGRPRGTWNRGKLRAQTGAVRVCVCVRVCAWAGRACERQRTPAGTPAGTYPGASPGASTGTCPGAAAGRSITSIVMSIVT